MVLLTALFVVTVSYENYTQQSNCEQNSIPIDTHIKCDFGALQGWEYKTCDTEDGNRFSNYCIPAEYDGMCSHHRTGCYVSTTERLPQDLIGHQVVCPVGHFINNWTVRDDCEQPNEYNIMYECCMSKSFGGLQSSRSVGCLNSSTSFPRCNSDEVINSVYAMPCGGYTFTCIAEGKGMISFCFNILTKQYYSLWHINTNTDQFQNSETIPLFGDGELSSIASFSFKFTAGLCDQKNSNNCFKAVGASKKSVLPVLEGYQVPKDGYGQTTSQVTIVEAIVGNDVVIYLSVSTDSGKVYLDGNEIDLSVLLSRRWHYFDVIFSSSGIEFSIDGISKIVTKDLVNSHSDGDINIRIASQSVVSDLQFFDPQVAETYSTQQINEKANNFIIQTKVMMKLDDSNRHFEIGLWIRPQFGSWIDQTGYQIPRAIQHSDGMIRSSPGNVDFNLEYKGLLLRISLGEFHGDLRSVAKFVFINGLEILISQTYYGEIEIEIKTSDQTDISIQKVLSWGTTTDILIIEWSGTTSRTMTIQGDVILTMDVGSQWSSLLSFEISMKKSFTIEDFIAYSSFNTMNWMTSSSIPAVEPTNVPIQGYNFYNNDICINDVCYKKDSMKSVPVIINKNSNLYSNKATSLFIVSLSNEYSCLSVLHQIGSEPIKLDYGSYGVCGNVNGYDVALPFSVHISKIRSIYGSRSGVVVIDASTSKHNISMLIEPDQNNLKKMKISICESDYEVEIISNPVVIDVPVDFFLKNNNDNKDHYICIDGEPTIWYIHVIRIAVNDQILPGGNPRNLIAIPYSASSSLQLKLTVEGSSYYIIDVWLSISGSSCTGVVFGLFQEEESAGYQISSTHLSFISDLSTICIGVSIVGSVKTSLLEPISINFFEFDMILHPSQVATGCLSTDSSTSVFVMAGTTLTSSLVNQSMYLDLRQGSVYLGGHQSVESDVEKSFYSVIKISKRIDWKSPLDVKLLFCLGNNRKSCFVFDLGKVLLRKIIFTEAAAYSFRGMKYEKENWFGNDKQIIIPSLSGEQMHAFKVTSDPHYVGEYRMTASFIHSSCSEIPISAEPLIKLHEYPEMVSLNHTSGYGVLAEFSSKIFQSENTDGIICISTFQQNVLSHLPSAWLQLGFGISVVKAPLQFFEPTTNTIVSSNYDVVSETELFVLSGTELRLVVNFGEISPTSSSTPADEYTLAVKTVPSDEVLFITKTVLMFSREVTSRLSGKKNYFIIGGTKGSLSEGHFTSGYLSVVVIAIGFSIGDFISPLMPTKDVNIDRSFGVSNMRLAIHEAADSAPVEFSTDDINNFKKSKILIRIVEETSDCESQSSPPTHLQQDVIFDIVSVVRKANQSASLSSTFKICVVCSLISKGDLFTQKYEDMGYRTATVNVNKIGDEDLSKKRQINIAVTLAAQGAVFGTQTSPSNVVSGSQLDGLVSSQIVLQLIPPGGSCIVRNPPLSSLVGLTRLFRWVFPRHLLIPGQHFGLCISITPWGGDHSRVYVPVPVSFVILHFNSINNRFQGEDTSGLMFFARLPAIFHVDCEDGCEQHNLTSHPYVLTISDSCSSQSDIYHSAQLRYDSVQKWHFNVDRIIETRKLSSPPDICINGASLTMTVRSLSLSLAGINLGQGSYKPVTIRETRNRIDEKPTVLNFEATGGVMSPMWVTFALKGKCGTIEGQRVTGVSTIPIRVGGCSGAVSISRIEYAVRRTPVNETIVFCVAASLEDESLPPPLNFFQDSEVRYSVVGHESLHVLVEPSQVDHSTSLMKTSPKLILKDEEGTVMTTLSQVLEIWFHFELCEMDSKIVEFCLQDCELLSRHSPKNPTAEITCVEYCEDMAADVCDRWTVDSSNSVHSFRITPDEYATDPVIHTGQVYLSGKHRVVYRMIFNAQNDEGKLKVTTSTFRVGPCYDWRSGWWHAERFRFNGSDADNNIYWSNGVSKYALPNSTHCLPCPVGAYCDGSSDVRTSEDYWRSTFSSYTFYKCEKSEACLGNQSIGYCADDHEPHSLSNPNPLCRTCQFGFIKSTSRFDCQQCLDTLMQWVIISLWCIFAFIIVLFLIVKAVSSGQRAKRSSSFTIVVKMLITHCSTASLLGNYGNDIAVQLQELLDIQNFATGGSLGEMNNLNCVIDISYYEKFVLIMLLPLIFPMILAVVIGFLFIIKYIKTGSWVSSSKKKKRLTETEADGIYDDLLRLKSIDPETEEEEQGLTVDDVRLLYTQYLSSVFRTYVGLSQRFPDCWILWNELQEGFSTKNNSRMINREVFTKTILYNPSERMSTRKQLDTDKIQKTDDWLGYYLGFDSNRLFHGYVAGNVIALVIAQPHLVRRAALFIQCREYDHGNSGSKNLFKHDMSLNCDDDEFKIYFSIAMFCLVLYGVGIPIVSRFGVSLISKYTIASSNSKREKIRIIKERPHDQNNNNNNNNNNHQYDEQERRINANLMFGYLTAGYHDDALYWESIIMLRKCLLVVISVYAQGNAATHFAVWTLLSFCVLQHKHQPYQDATLNRLESISLLTIIATLELSILYNKETGNLSSEHSSPWVQIGYWCLTFVLISANIVTVLMITWGAIKTFPEYVSDVATDCVGGINKIYSVIPKVVLSFLVRASRGGLITRLDPSTGKCNSTQLLLQDDEIENDGLSPTAASGNNNCCCGGKSSPTIEKLQHFKDQIFLGVPWSRVPKGTVILRRSSAGYKSHEINDSISACVSSIIALLVISGEGIYCKRHSIISASSTVSLLNTTGSSESLKANIVAQSHSEVRSDVGITISTVLCDHPQKPVMKFSSNIISCELVVFQQFGGCPSAIPEHRQTQSFVFEIFYDGHQNTADPTWVKNIPNFDAQKPQWVHTTSNQETLILFFDMLNKVWCIAQLGKQTSQRVLCAGLQSSSDARCLSMPHILKWESALVSGDGIDHHGIPHTVSFVIMNKQLLKNTDNLDNENSDSQDPVTSYLKTFYITDNADLPFLPDRCVNSPTWRSTAGECSGYIFRHKSMGCWIVYDNGEILTRSKPTSSNSMPHEASWDPKTNTVVGSPSSGIVVQILYHQRGDPKQDMITVVWETHQCRWSPSSPPVILDKHVSTHSRESIMMCDVTFDSDIRWEYLSKSDLLFGTLNRVSCFARIPQGSSVATRCNIKNSKGKILFSEACHEIFSGGPEKVFTRGAAEPTVRWIPQTGILRGMNQVYESSNRFINVFLSEFKKRSGILATQLFPRGHLAIEFEFAIISGECRAEIEPLTCTIAASELNINPNNNKDGLSPIANRRESGGLVVDEPGFQCVILTNASAPVDGREPIVRAIKTASLEIDIMLQISRRESIIVPFDISIQLPVEGVDQIASPHPSQLSEILSRHGNLIPGCESPTKNVSDLLSTPIRLPGAASPASLSSVHTFTNSIVSPVDEICIPIPDFIIRTDIPFDNNNPDNEICDSNYNGDATDNEVAVTLPNQVALLSPIRSEPLSPTLSYLTSDCVPYLERALTPKAALPPLGSPQGNSNTQWPLL